MGYGAEPKSVSGLCPVADLSLCRRLNSAKVDGAVDGAVEGHSAGVARGVAVSAALRLGSLPVTDQGKRYGTARAQRRRSKPAHPAPIDNRRSEPGDEQAGEWSRDHLLRIGEKFRRRLERAIERGTDTRQPESALHSITSSARASSVGGTVRPSAFAVLRLII